MKLLSSLKTIIQFFSPFLLFYMNCANFYFSDRLADCVQHLDEWLSIGRRESTIFDYFKRFFNILLLLIQTYYYFSNKKKYVFRLPTRIPSNQKHFSFHIFYKNTRVIEYIYAISDHLVVHRYNQVRKE